MARLAIHFGDGSQEEVELTFGDTLFDWDLEDDSVIDLNHIATRNLSPRPNDMKDVVTSHLAWINPHPDRKISHIDFISGRQNAAPFLIAVTVE